MQRHAAQRPADAERVRHVGGSRYERRRRVRGEVLGPAFVVVVPEPVQGLVAWNGEVLNAQVVVKVLAQGLGDFAVGVRVRGGQHDRLVAPATQQRLLGVHRPERVVARGEAGDHHGRAAARAVRVVERLQRGELGGVHAVDRARAVQGRLEVPSFVRAPSQARTRSVSVRAGAARRGHGGGRGERDERQRQRGHRAGRHERGVARPTLFRPMY